MASSARKTGGLAARLVRVVVIIGTATVLVAGTVAIIGASRLAADQVAARDQATLLLVEDKIVQRLGSAEILASQLAAASATTTDHANLDDRVKPVYEAAAGLVDSIIIAERRGKVITAYPASAEATVVASTQAYRDAVRGVTGFSRDPAGGWKLWLTRTVATPQGVPAIILLHVDLEPLREVIERATQGSERAVIVLDSGVPIHSSGQTGTVEVVGARWTPTREGAGRVRVPAADRGTYSGYYTDVRAIEGLLWRVVVLEPSSTVASDTAVAVIPWITVLLIGAMALVAAAWMTTRRLVQPLRTLETAAYRAATGAYVKPVPATGEDEIGQVAVAFNAMALRLNALHDLSQLLASSSQLDQVLDGILSAIGHIVGGGVAAVYLLDESGRWLVPARARGADASRAAAVDALGDTWLARALRETDEVAHSGDAQRLADELPGLAASGSAALVAPLVSGHDALGAIVVLRDATEPISEAEREMVRTFSAQAAVAVQNSRLFAVETESRRVAEALRSVAEQLVRPEGLGPALERVEEIVAELFGAMSATFAVVDRRALGLAPASDRPEEGALLGLALRVLMRAGASNPVLVRSGDDEGGDEILAQSGAEELLVVPVAFASDHGAALIIALSGRTAGTRDIELAEALSNEIELAFDNAYLLERAVTRASNLETIFRISQAVGSSLQINVVLNRVLDVVQKILSADAVALMTYDSRRRMIKTAMARGAVSPDIVDLELAPGDDVPGYVFSTGEPASFRDLHEAMGGIAGDAAAHGLRSMLGVPLLARGRSIGVLMVFSAEPGAFSDEDMSILQTFAAQAALAIDTARLYSREHDVATILQASILPEALPEMPEVEASSVYEPAGAEAEIGGDYYDLFRAFDGSVWFAIADVCGKGVVAATKTSMIKYSVRSLVAAGLRPSAVIGEVNRMVAETGEASDIVTLWVGRLDAEAGELSWASGGHPPGFLLRAGSAETERLVPTGPLLGAIADVVFAEESVSVGPGDAVMLYTDGVTEARRGNEFFGEDRVRDVLLGGGSPDEVVRRLLTAVRRFVHGDLRDDVAVLVLTVRGGQGAGPDDDRDVSS